MEQSSSCPAHVEEPLAACTAATVSTEGDLLRYLYFPLKKFIWLIFEFQKTGLQEKVLLNYPISANVTT